MSQQKKQKTEKLVVVFGATGQQGGSVITQLLTDPNYAIRGVVKNTTSPSAQELTKLGVEIMDADLQDASSLDEVMEGAYAVFAMTIPEYAGAKIDEVTQGKCLVDAAKRAGVRHFVWSTLANVERESGGRFKVKAFTDKALVQEYAQQAGFEYLSLPMPCFYFQNFLALAKPLKQNGKFLFVMPSELKVVYGWDVRDIGVVVHSMLEDPAKFNNVEMPLCSQMAPVEDLAKQFTEVTGLPAEIKALPAAKLREAGEMPEAIIEMFEWFAAFGYFGKQRDPMLGSKHFKLRSWADFLKETGWKGEMMDPAETLKQERDQVVG